MAFLTLNQVAAEGTHATSGVGTTDAVFDVVTANGIECIRLRTYAEGQGVAGGVKQTVHLTARQLSEMLHTMLSAV
ncbi:hypothetical protein [Hymenobacter edaphi]|uniref:hypothetical protein n=1 Tax=Hymenobacter edaphi TaxID=2211146 RepID=UPI001057D4A7|nr:hypothetical protein [Hymenobacter edaphi]